MQVVREKMCEVAVPEACQARLGPGKGASFYFFYTSTNGTEDVVSRDAHDATEAGCEDGDLGRAA